MRKIESDVNEITSRKRATENGNMRIKRNGRKSGRFRPGFTCVSMSFDQRRLDRNV